MSIGDAPQHTPVVDPDLGRLAGEGADLVAVGVQRVQRGGERAPVRGGHVGPRVAEVEERRLEVGRPVRDGKRTDVAGHRGSDLPQPRQHGLRPAEAVHADDVRAALLQHLLTQGWAQLGIPLGPIPSDRHVLGWSVLRSTPDCALLGVGTSAGLQAELLVERRLGTLVLASFIQQHTDEARASWDGVEHRHSPTMRRLLEEAIARA
jgi:hypothetical protein